MTDEQNTPAEGTEGAAEEVKAEEGTSSEGDGGSSEDSQ